MVETWKMLVSFILVIVAFDLSLGLPFVYGEKGLLEQTLAPNTEFSDDLFLGVWLENNLYDCTSWASNIPPYSELPKCSEEQTKNIYILVAIVIPILALVIVFTLLNPKAFIGLLKEGL